MQRDVCTVCRMQFNPLARSPQGLAAGLMLSISLLDLLPEAAEEIGFVAANAYFYLGVLFFAAVVYFIPEPDATWLATTPATISTPKYGPS
jgi:zinc transporter, ZIP family